jgi:hypothetical protein
MFSFLQVFQEIFYVFLTLAMRGRAHMPSPPHPYCYYHVRNVTIDGIWTFKQLVTTTDSTLFHTHYSVHSHVFTIVVW